MTVTHEYTMTSRDGVPLRVFDWGDSRNDAVVIVNAYGSRIGLVSKLAERLALNKHVMSWESRWVPRITTDFDKTKLDVNNQVNDALDIMNFFGRTRASVIGFCTGAQITLAFAAVEPGRVEQLALLNGSFSFSAKIEHTEFETFFSALLKKAIQSPQMAKSWLAFIGGSGSEGTTETWARLEHLGASERELLYLANSFLEDAQGEDMHRYALMIDQFRKFDIEDCARKVFAPASIVFSQNDKVSHPMNSIKIHGLLRNARLLPHQESGHYAVYDSPTFIAAVAAELENTARNSCA